MRQNEPNIYIEEKKMRSIGGYGQRSRSARAATGCGVRILGLYAAPRRLPHTADAYPETAENHVRALATGTARCGNGATERDAAILFSIYYICLIFIIFSHFDILFFSWCAPQLTCCAWPVSICRPITWSTVFDTFFRYRTYYFINNSEKGAKFLIFPFSAFYSQSSCVLFCIYFFKYVVRLFMWTIIVWCFIALIRNKF